VESIAVIVLLLLGVALLRNVAAGTWQQWLHAKFIGT
jgi:hypothetical protein